MDRDFLIELFAGFGPVTVRRMFGGFGISADSVNFALVLRGAVYLRVDDASVPQFESEGSGPFQYQAKGVTRSLGSYWRLPERLYDDPDELAEWARTSHAAAQRAAFAKATRKRKPATKVAAGIKAEAPANKKPVRRRPG